MAFKNAQQTRVLVGSLNYSAYATTASVTSETMMLETTTLVDAAKRFIPGLTGANLSLDLLMDTDTATGGEWSNATAWKSNSTLPITYANAGLTTGSECFLVRGLETAFTIASKTSDKVTANLSALTTDATDVGTVLEDLTVITATGNGTARDLTAASTNGGIAHLHVTAFSGVTNDIVTIEHSVDGATAWATLVTFATVTGITSEAFTVAAGTAVRRYLRVVDTVTLTPTLTRSVAFARR